MSENDIRQNQKIKSIWRRVFIVAACVVVFITTYALILPAITATMNCQLNVHQHTGACYTEVTDAEGNTHRELICGYADYVVHTHNELCYSEDASGNRVLICELPEIEKHVHDESCYTEETVLVCAQDEADGHVHSESCYEVQKILTCGQQELHTHNKDCYDENGNLICGLLQLEEHVHGSECFLSGDETESEKEASEGTLSEAVSHAFIVDAVDDAAIDDASVEAELEEATADAAIEEIVTDAMIEEAVPDASIEEAVGDAVTTEEETVAADGAEETSDEAVDAPENSKGIEQQLTELADITLTRSSYTEQDRNATLDLAFQYSIKSDKLSTAKDNSPWIYDLSGVVGNDKVLSALQGEGGALWAGSTQSGRYVIEGTKIKIYPDSSYVQDKNELHGTFVIKATLNESINYNKTGDTIEFPGGAKVDVTYKEKHLNHYKTVGPTENATNYQEGDVEVVNEGGKYYLYYRIALKPDADLTTLSITDSLSAGQTLIADSIKFYAGGTEIVATSGLALTYDAEKHANGFTLDAAKLAGESGIKAWTDYVVTYKAEVDQEKLNQGSLTNEATYHWDGENITDQTKVTPKFEGKLETSKYVGGSSDSIYATSGNVDVQQDGNGDYYLYYCITAQPNVDLDELTVQDTVEAGQEIDVESIKLFIGDSEQSTSGMTVAGDKLSFSGTITPDGGIKANTTYKITYRTKLVKNNDSDASELSSAKKNKSEWTWTGEPKTDETTVTPRVPDPKIPIDKKASLYEAKAGDTITYTMTVGGQIDGEFVDLAGYTVSDYIANFINADSFDQNNITKCGPRIGSKNIQT